MLINLSNHPYKQWSERQKQAALPYGEVREIPFPAVDAQADEKVIEDLAADYLHQIKCCCGSEKATIHIMGELTFTYALIRLLQAEGFKCIASTSKRMVSELSNQDKVVCFQFERFRYYI